MGKICPECGVYISDWKRHMRGYRIKDKKTGKIIYTKRCRRQHIRKENKPSKKGVTNHAGKPYSQGY